MKVMIWWLQGYNKPDGVQERIEVEGRREG